MKTRRSRLAALFAVLALAATACGGDGEGEPGGSDPTDAGQQATEGTTTDDPTAGATGDDAEGGTLVVYSGRGEDLVAQPIADFEEATGIDVEVRYGDTAELAATILEEGEGSPADVYWAQDAGALGALAEAGRLQALSEDVLSRVDERFRSPDGLWTGITGRVRTIVYNTDELSESDVPGSVLDLTDPEWEGRVGWAPTNGSFQAFVTAMRQVLGEDETRAWLEGMLDNGVQEYPKNSPIVEAVGRGEIDLGLVNHYYLLRFKAEDPQFPAANAFLTEDIGGLVNVAGVGILDSAENVDAAQRFVEFMLSEETQTYFASVTDEAEYPLIDGVEPADTLPPLESLNPPALDLSNLADLQGTLELLREVGALQ